MILVIGGVKGGSGKSTLATNLTVLRSASGKKVLLIDADEQRTSADWADQRAGQISTPWVTVSLLGAGIYAQIIKLAKDYDDIIIDTGGRDTTSQRSALSVADLYVVPFKPRCYDVWTVGQVKKIINEILPVNRKLKTFFVINQADPRGSDNESAIDILDLIEGDNLNITCLRSFIGNRKSFSNAAADGLGIIELENTDQKANNELKCLYDSIYAKYTTDIQEI